jgi:hypothetical protein
MKKKRIIAISDPHCGSQVGLTHPDWQYKKVRGDATKLAKYQMIQSECWDWTESHIKPLLPCDGLLVMGDTIDGPGKRSGGVEQITSHRLRQIEMFQSVLEMINPPKIMLAFGTEYHVGDIEDWEELIRYPNIKTGNHEWADVNGLIFDCKHKVGSSQIPHGRFTSLAREKLWSGLWAEAGLTPKARVILRGHVHYHVYCGSDDFLAMTMPALQAMGTRFGARQCSGIVDFGFVHFDVEDNGEFTWQAHIAKIKAQKARAVKF